MPRRHTGAANGDGVFISDADADAGKAATSPLRQLSASRSCSFLHDIVGRSWTSPLREVATADFLLPLLYGGSPRPAFLLLVVFTLVGYISN